MEAAHSSEKLSVHMITSMETWVFVDMTMTSLSLTIVPSAISWSGPQPVTKVYKYFVINSVQKCLDLPLYVLLKYI